MPFTDLGAGGASRASRSHDRVILYDSSTWDRGLLQSCCGVMPLRAMAPSEQTTRTGKWLTKLTQLYNYRPAGFMLIAIALAWDQHCSQPAH